MSIDKKVVEHKKCVSEILNAVFEWREIIATVVTKYLRLVAKRIYVAFVRLSVFSVSFSEPYYVSFLKHVGNCADFPRHFPSFFSIYT